MNIPDKYRDRYDALAEEHPWMREMVDETNGLDGGTNETRDEITSSEGDAVKLLREAAGSDVSNLLLINSTSSYDVEEAYAKLADMVERDYVKRESIEGVMDTDRELVAENIRLTAERDELKAKVDDIMDEPDYREAWERMHKERDEWKTKCETREVAYKQADAERKRYSEQIDELRAERDEWKAKAEGQSKVRVGSSNLEWLVENDRDGLVLAMCCDEPGRADCSDCAAWKETNSCLFKREWLMAPHSDPLSDSESSQRASESDQREQERACESYMELVDAQRDRNGTCPDGNGTASDISDNLGKSQDSEITEPDTIRNELEDNGYVVMPYHNGEKQAKLRGMEYDQVIFDDLHDSREKLEADVRYRSIRPTTKIDCHYDDVLRWLDRQDAITKSEWALFNDYHRLECENRNLSMDLADCMEAKGALEDELRAVKRQLKQERGLHSVTLNNWEQAKGKLQRERESLQAWKSKLDERDAKTRQEVADEQAAEYREKAERWKRAAEEAHAKLLSVREAVDGVKDAVDDVRGMV